MFQNLKTEAASWKNKKVLLTNGEVNKWIPVSSDLDMKLIRVGETQCFELVKNPFEGGVMVKSVGEKNEDAD